MSKFLESFFLDNVLSFVSLNVAIISALCGLMLWLINWKLEEKLARQELIINEIRKSLFCLQGIAKNSAECFVQVDAVSNLHRLLCERLMRGDPCTDDKQKIIRFRYAESMRDFNRSLQTLVLFTDNPIWRQSAYKQLSVNLGDASTLQTFKQLQSMQNMGKHGQDADLPGAIKDLETRINEALKSVSR